MSVHSSEILAAIINFILLFFLAKHFYFDKVKNVIEERNKIIKDNIDKAIADREEAEILLKSAYEEKATAKENGLKLIAEQKLKAESLYEEIVEEAREEAKLIIERGQVDIEREREQSRKETRQNVLELATLLSKKAIAEDANEETHKKLIDEIIDKVGEN